MLLVISSERGLCGAFNERLIERVRSDLARRRSAGAKVVLVCLGRRGAQLLQAAREDVTRSWPLPSFALSSYLDIERTVIELLNMMDDQGCDRLEVMHNRQLHRFQYEVESSRLFPLEPTMHAGDAIEVRPTADTPALLTQLVTDESDHLYQAVIESAVAEELARVAAMRLAADNARHILEELTVEANRARQIAETNALLEILNGFQVSTGTSG